MTAAFLAACLLAAASTSLPWAESVGSPEPGSIHAVAAVVVSDGSSFETRTLYVGPQRAVVRQLHPDEMVTLGVDGMYYWANSGEAEREAPDMVREFVLGHQFHAQVLFFDSLHPEASVEPASYKGGDYLVLRDDTWSMYYREGEPPRALQMQVKNQPPVVCEFSDWKDVSGVQLPFRIEISDGERDFTYTFTEVSFNQGSLDDYRAPYSSLNEEQKLLRLHRLVMDAHLSGDASLMNRYWADSVMVVSSGEVIGTPGAQAAQQFEHIFATRDYTVYDDMIRPVVRISPDGSMGWVMVQVKAEGVYHGESAESSEPFAFVSAWIELYEKRGGEWRITGNVSNFAPDTD